MAPTEMNTDCLNDGQTLFSKDGTISLLTFSPLKSGSALDLKSGWLDSLMAKSAAEVVLYDFQGKARKSHATLTLFPWNIHTQSHTMHEYNY